jgi:hypothetical protein
MDINLLGGLGRRSRLDPAKASAETATLPEEVFAKGGEARTVRKQGRASLPAGKASLIRASFESGMKPQAIARTLRIALAQVNEVLATKAKRKR